MSPVEAIYWDYNASAPLRPEVASGLSERLLWAIRHAGNASSVHQGGQAARALLEAARRKVGELLGVEPKEVCFTSSGSEANALALKGAFFGRDDKSRTKVVISHIEHPSLLDAAAQLAEYGAEIIQIRPDSNGRMDTEEVARVLDRTVAVCSFMWANNETGVLQPVAEIASICEDLGVLFHTDAVQAMGKVSVSFRDVHAAMLSFSAHKLGGPTGIGALVVRQGVALQPLVPGHQEGGRRGGTASPFLAEALALSLELALADLRGFGSVERLRDLFEREVQRIIPGARVNGASVPRVSNTSNLCFGGADGQELLIALDLAGIRVSTGAACASGSLSPSHVLLAMGLSAEEAKGSLRFSLGPSTADSEVARVVEILRTAVRACVHP